MIDRRRLLNSLQKLDYEMRLRHYPVVIEAKGSHGRRWREELDEEIDAIERMDAEKFFEDEQAPVGDRAP